jgi:hypothetical protein
MCRSDVMRWGAREDRDQEGGRRTDLVGRRGDGVKNERQHKRPSDEESAQLHRYETPDVVVLLANGWGLHILPSGLDQLSEGAAILPRIMHTYT